MTIIVNPSAEGPYTAEQQHEDRRMLGDSAELLREFVYADKLVQILWRQLVLRTYGIDLLDRGLDDLHLLPYDVRSQLYDFVSATRETLRKTISRGWAAGGFTTEQDGALALHLLAGLARDLPEGQLTVEVPGEDVINAAFRLRQLCEIKVYK